MGDPACSHPNAPTEATACQNGADDDGDGARDYDGGRLALGAGHPDVGSADPQCEGRPWRASESPSGCGLGFEPALLLSLRRLLRRVPPGARGA